MSYSKEKKKEYDKKYREQNKERIIERSKKYYEENNEKKKEYNRKHYEQNKEKRKEQHQKYREENKQKIKEQSKKYYEKNKEKIKEQSKEYYEKNKEKVIKRTSQRDKIRYQEDKSYRISQNLRSRLQYALKGIGKAESTMALLGCSAEQLRTHLEEKFTDGMSWDNYGYRGWHIDHIRPCASFDLTDPQQQLECFHYTNLQPLWAEDNFKKGDIH